MYVYSQVLEWNSRKPLVEIAKESSSRVGFMHPLPYGMVECGKTISVVILSYNRDAILSATLERLHKLPYLNRVIVVWNNADREPQGPWPKLHVPIVFIRGATNSLNNRFIPYDKISTEAVLSMDDDIGVKFVQIHGCNRNFADLKQHEIVFAFR